ncbi:hypothetical protein HPB51_028205 [Rhipicephalus microplus]|uniref:Tick transposon n=1 Tax=Rhipicephalus microplus TaxID=6941 RepID=A0A9J6CXZ1_RHIMP|nr:hypothetical protein HPB51_028205 [Rhipicephalus microplus]
MKWPKFRDVHECEAPQCIRNLKEWTASLGGHVRRTTRESKAAEETPATDSRLLHMWNAHASLLRRWQKQRYNKKLRRLIQTHCEEIEQHSAYLARQQWGKLCNGLNEQLGNKKTWHLLLHLLDLNDSKTAAWHRLKRLVHQHLGSDEDLLTWQTSPSTMPTDQRCHYHPMKLLDPIPIIRHTLYADDVTVWTTTGSDGQIGEALQRAVDTVAEYVARAGLECLVEK